MTRLLCEADPEHLFASELDAPHTDGSPNYTVNTLQALRRDLPGARLFAIAGMDSFLDLPHWRSASLLLELAEWIVVSRPGHTMPEPPPGWLPPDRVHILAELQIPTASRIVRDQLLRDGDLSGSISPAVAAYIRRHHLYGSCAPLHRHD